MITRESVLAGPRRGTVEVTVAGQTALLRYPSFSEWRGIVARHQEQSPVSAEDAAAAVAIVLVDEAGNRLFSDRDSGLLLSADPALIAGLYAEAWKTVLKVDDEEIEAAKEK